ncbi:MAG: ArsA family ATPase [Candidatus Lokiarchaeota archaeon]|nr:ArsA family ATPase [Candidatus Lokiarchaeota archaeon]
MQLLIFGGKGGVGKSSISAATAVKLSELVPKTSNILLISFDIAHNLSDLFERPIGNELTQILPNLWAIEPDPELYAQKVTQRFGELMREFISSMPIVRKMPKLEEYIENTFTTKSMTLSMKNALFFQRIIDADDIIEDMKDADSAIQNFDLLQKMKFDYIVADFPPTGNMISLFEVPKNTIQIVLKSTLTLFSEMKEFFKNIQKATKILNPFSKGTTEDQKNRSKEILEIINNVEKRAERVTNLMRESGSLRLVTIPEKPSYEELKRARDLTTSYINLDAVHINRIIHEKYHRCEMCRKVRKIQNKYIQAIESDFSNIMIWKSHMLLEEPIGLNGLKKLGNEIFGSIIDAQSILKPEPTQ